MGVDLLYSPFGRHYLYNSTRHRIICLRKKEQEKLYILLKSLQNVISFRFVSGKVRNVKEETNNAQVFHSILRLNVLFVVSGGSGTEEIKLL